MRAFQMTLVCAMATGSAFADISVSNYEDLFEGSLGSAPFHYNGVTYTDVNNVHGVFPDGNTFVPGGTAIESLGDDIIIENAAFFYDSFPSWGSRNKAMTFGRAFIPGDNLTLGAISTLTMNLDSVADFASLDIGYFENGPWGGIVFHFQALMGATVVGEDTFTISDLGGRDNGAIATMSVGGAQFDSLQLFATLGNDFTAPRVLLDDLTINTIPAPSAAALLIGAGGLASRRRR